MRATPDCRLDCWDQHQRLQGSLAWCLFPTARQGYRSFGVTAVQIITPGNATDSLFWNKSFSSNFHCYTKTKTSFHNHGVMQSKNLAKTQLFPGATHHGFHWWWKSRALATALGWLDISILATHAFHNSFPPDYPSVRCSLQKAAWLIQLQVNEKSSSYRVCLRALSLRTKHYVNARQKFVFTQDAKCAKSTCRRASTAAESSRTWNQHVHMS